MQMVRDSNLVFRAGGKGSQREREFRELERVIVSAERVEGGLYNLSSKPFGSGGSLSRPRTA